MDWTMMSGMFPGIHLQNFGTDVLAQQGQSFPLRLAMVPIALIPLYTCSSTSTICQVHTSMCAFEKAKHGTTLPSRS